MPLYTTMIYLPQMIAVLSSYSGISMLQLSRCETSSTRKPNRQTVCSLTSFYLKTEAEVSIFMTVRGALRK
jgi:hypothetical protein